MIAGVIFSIALIGMIGVWSLYYSAITKSKNMLVATALCRQVMESTLAFSYNDIPITPPAGPLPAAVSYVIQGQIRGRTFQTRFDATMVARDHPYPPYAGLIKIVTVQVDWIEETGPKSVYYETRITKT